MFPKTSTFIANILDIRQNTLSVLIGTLFKDMKRKPNILKDITGTLGSRRPITYCGEEDTCVLEDSSGRIRLKDKTSDGNFISKIVTGTIIACLGRADINGIFFVEDYVFADYCNEPNIVLPTQIIDTKRSLFDPEAL